MPAPCHPVPRDPPRESSNERKKGSKAVAQQQRADAIGSLTSSGLSVAELEAMVEHITEVHRQHTPHTAEFFAMLPQKEKEFLVRLPLPPSPSDLYPTLTSVSFSFKERRELQNKMFGSMKPIPREEYMRIYQTTGKQAPLLHTDALWSTFC